MGEKNKGIRITLKSGIILIVVMAVIFFMGFFAAVKSSQPVTKITEATLQEQLKSISDLATTEYNYTNMGKFENSHDLNGWSVPLTKKSFILSYDGKITAGIHLEDIEFDVSDEKISVKLPEAVILSHEIDESSIQNFDESNNIFNPIKISDYTTFKLDQMEVMEQKAIDKGLLKNAASEAAAVIYNLLSVANPDHEIEVK